MIVPDVMSSTGYVRRPLLIKEKSHLWYYLQELWGRMNPDHMGCLWKEISVQPTGIILEVALRADLKNYVEETLAKDKEAVQLVGLVPFMIKINTGTGKGREESIMPEKLGIEKGETPKGDDGRVPLEVWNKNKW